MKEEFGVFWKVRRRTEGIFVRWERRQVGVGGDLRVDETVGLLSTWCVARPTFWHFWVPCFFLGPGGVLWENKKYITPFSFTTSTPLLILPFKSVSNDSDFKTTLPGMS